jgi:hypothetical protein
VRPLMLNSLSQKGVWRKRSLAHDCPPAKIRSRSGGFPAAEISLARRFGNRRSLSIARHG